MTVHELLAVAAAAGVLRDPTAPSVAAHRTGPGRRVPGWLRLPRQTQPRRWNAIVRALGLALAAIGAALTTFVVVLGLSVSATGAALLGVIVGLAAAVVLR